MKKRLGFVSNSSSSSFIIGIARVTDEKKLSKYIKSSKISSVHIDTVKNLSKRTYDFAIKDDKLTLESFMSDVRTKFTSMEDKIVYLDITGGDDSDFWDGDYYNYDIDLDFFSSEERKAFNLFFRNDVGIEGADATYGAGRDG